MHGLIFETSICYWQDQPGILFRFFIVSRVWSTRAKAWLAPRSPLKPSRRAQNSKTFFDGFFFTRLYIRSLEPEIGFIRDRSFSFSSPSSTTHTHMRRRQHTHKSEQEANDVQLQNLTHQHIQPRTPSQKSRRPSEPNNTHTHNTTHITAHTNTRT